MSHSNFEHNNMRVVHNSGKFYFLKKAVQTLLSISLFSFLYYQSSNIPLLFQSFDYNYYSTKIFTYKSERNYIFLLCNGILVLIIQISGVINKITPLPSNVKVTTTSHQELKSHDGEHDQIAVKKEEIVTKVEASVREESEVLVVSDDVVVVQKGEIFIEESENVDDEEYWVEEELSDDELHKKCEDFIKKVKQEIQGEFL